MKKNSIAKNHLVEGHYCATYLTQTMTLRELQETMLYGGGKTICKGVLKKIKFNKLCPGVYNVWLEGQNPAEDK
jgi:uncharacterized protein (DUF2225 family)